MANQTLNPLGETHGSIRIKINENFEELYAGIGGAVDSVNGETGVVVLDKSDVGLGNVDDTSDITKSQAGNPVGDAIIAGKLKVVTNSDTTLNVVDLGALTNKTFTSDVDLTLALNEGTQFDNQLTVGELIAIKNNGDYKITILPVTGVTVDAVDDDLTIYGKYEVRVLVYEGNNHWTLI